MSMLALMIFAVSNLQFLLVGSLRRDFATFVDNAFQINGTFKPTFNNRASTGGEARGLVDIRPTNHVPEGVPVKSAHARGGSDVALWLASSTDRHDKYKSYIRPYNSPSKSTILMSEKTLRDCVEKITNFQEKTFTPKVLVRCHICGFCSRISRNDPFHTTVCRSCITKGKVINQKRTRVMESEADSPEELRRDGIILRIKASNLGGAMESEADSPEELHVVDKGAIARRPFWSSWFEEAQRLCCCKVVGKQKLTALTCTWKQPHTFDTGSGCNKVGLFNKWADQRRVSGTIDSSGTIAPFDTSLYGGDTDKQKAQEDNYQKICSALSGDVVGRRYEIGNGTMKHHWFLRKIEKEQILEVAKIPQNKLFAVKLAVAVAQVAKDPVIKVGKKTSPAVGEEARALQNLEVKPVSVDEAKQLKMTKMMEEEENSITTKMIRSAAAENSGRLCLSLCQPWPAPLGRLTRLTPKKGCQVLDKYRCDKQKKKRCGGLKDIFSKSVVKEYCKNQCAGLYNGTEFMFGDCTTGPTVSRSSQ